MEATQEYTYGFKQAEVLGALLSVAIVWALTAVLLWEAVPRFIEPRPINGKIMFSISFFGFGVNLILMKVLGHGHSHGGDDHGHSHGDDNVAVQAALAHVIGDIVQSLGVCLAALCIWLQPLDVGTVWTSRGEVSRWNYAARSKLIEEANTVVSSARSQVPLATQADPLCTCLFGVIVLHTTKATMVRTTETLMGKAPSKIDQNKLYLDLEKIPNVTSIHDLHVWQGLFVGQAKVDEHEHQARALGQAIETARRAGVGHSTFQMEVLGDMLTMNCGGCEASPKVFANGDSIGHGHAHAHAGEGGWGAMTVLWAALLVALFAALLLPMLALLGMAIFSSQGTLNDNEERLKHAVVFALLFMMVEIVGGLIETWCAFCHAMHGWLESLPPTTQANSLAIITDAAHMLSDVGGFIVMAATNEYTYGFKQVEVLGALISVSMVWALTAALLWEAVPRFMEPRPIDGKIMFFISLFGFLVNLILMKVLGHGHSHGDHGHCHGDGDVAVQAALAHVIGDIVQSLGVCLAALCIWLQPLDLGSVETSYGEVSRWNYADPLCTCLFGLIVLQTTKSTIVRTTETLMGKVPAMINQMTLSADLEKITHVSSVHDLHIWTMGSADVICTAHLVVDQHKHQAKALRQAIKVVRRAGVGHSTFQMEVLGDLSITDCGGCDSPKSVTSEHGHGHSHFFACANGHFGPGTIGVMLKPPRDGGRRLPALALLCAAFATMYHSLSFVNGYASGLQQISHGGSEEGDLAREAATECRVLGTSPAAGDDQQGDDECERYIFNDPREDRWQWGLDKTRQYLDEQATLVDEVKNKKLTSREDLSLPLPPTDLKINAMKRMQGTSADMASKEERKKKDEEAKKKSKDEQPKEQNLEEVDIEFMNYKGLVMTRKQKAQYAQRAQRKKQQEQKQEGPRKRR
eukprot:g16519.t1